MNYLSPRQLKAWLDDDSRAKPVLLDVREVSEYAICHIDGSLLIPMRTIPARMNELDPDAEIVAICHHGARSHQVAAFLEQQGYAHLHNLEGGVAAWAQMVDPTMPQY
jgi:rhodanese-related sulfurtransferase